MARTGKKCITLSIDREVVDSLRQHARRDDVSTNVIVEIALKKHLGLGAWTKKGGSE